MRLALALALAASAVAGTVQAQPPRATGTITIEQSLNVSTIRPLSFTGDIFAPQSLTPSRVTTPAIIEVTGDPGRFYKIKLPEVIVTEGGEAIVDSLSIVSETSGDISKTLTASMNAEGRDRLHIAGRLREINGLILTDIITAVPLSVDYE